jgi:hypothetical protein
MARLIIWNLMTLDGFPRDPHFDVRGGELSILRYARAT